MVDQVLREQPKGGARKATETPEGLSRSVTIRVSAKQYEELERSAKKRSVKVSSIARDRLFATAKRPSQSVDEAAIEALRENAEELRRTRVEVNRVGVLLNQIARKWHGGAVPGSDELRERYHELVTLWNEDRNFWRAAP